MNDRLINDFKNYLELERNYSNNTSLSYVKDVTLFSDFIKKNITTIIFIKHWSIKVNIFL